VRGALAVALGLIALQFFASSTLPGLVPALSYPATLAAKWLDPTVPLIAARSSASSAAPAATPAQTAAQQQGQATAGLSATPVYITSGISAH
jgi:hypothetical protein